MFIYIYKFLKNYQLNFNKKIKKDHKRKLMKDIKIFLKKKKKKSYTNLLEGEKMNWLSIKKDIVE